MPGTAGGKEGGPGGIFRPKSKEIRDHRDLRVWRKAKTLADRCREAVAGFPKDQAKLASVICRLADEVPHEIAAGQSQRHHAPYMDHLARSRTALRHLERRLIEAHKVNSLACAVGDPLLARTAEIERMLGKLMLSLELAYARRRAARSGG